MDISIKCHDGDRDETISALRLGFWMPQRHKTFCGTVLVHPRDFSDLSKHRCMAGLLNQTYVFNIRSNDLLVYD